MKTKTYRNLDTWARAMRADKDKKLWHDWFKINGHWYTCEEFDESGRYMRYTSITARRHIDIETSNRYSKTWLSDMVVTEYPIESLRFNIGYYIDDMKEWDRKSIMLLNIWLWDNKMYSSMRDLIDLLADNF